jgi:hypothetical protein
MHGNRRHALLLEGDREPDDRRATGTSQSNAENRGIALLDDGGAHFRVVDPALTRFDVLYVNRRQMLGEPTLELLHEDVGIIEQTVDQKDDLAIEPEQARCEALSGDLRRVTAWIVDGQLVGQTASPGSFAQLYVAATVELSPRVEFSGNPTYTNY